MGENAVGHEAGVSDRTCHVAWLGRVPYREAWDHQRELAARRAAGEAPDTLLLLEHPPTYTLGRRGHPEHLLVPREDLAREGIEVHTVDRGGDITFHGPGQLVGYPILDLHALGLRAASYLRRLEEVMIRTAAAFGLEAERLAEHRGVWVRGEKLAAIGVRVDARGISGHGFALNASTDLAHFRKIVPCGIRDRGVTTLSRLLGRDVAVEEVVPRVVDAFASVFSLRMHPPGPLARTAVGGYRKPPWLRIRLPLTVNAGPTQACLRSRSLHTVCEEARCPNRAECWSQGNATFLILGDVCTRDCGFCAVRTGRPQPPAPDEPERVAEAASAMGLRHVVVTSVTRDDLPDGGAGVFAETIRRVRARVPGCTVEVLVPDFQGDRDALSIVMAERPEILNHNVETVPRLYPSVRPQARYERSLRLLEDARALSPATRTKSGLMVGLGEEEAELLGVMDDLRGVGCGILTIGQYLAPSRSHLPVVHYPPPEAFDRLRSVALAKGFDWVEAGPRVRSSYHAESQARSGPGPLGTA